MYWSGAQVVTAALGLGTSVILARHLGPTLKGTVSLLSYSTDLVAVLCNLGIGEAAITLVGSGRLDLRRVAQSGIGAVLATSAVGMVLLYGLSVAIVGSTWTQLEAPIAIAAITVPVGAITEVLSRLMEILHRFRATSLTRVLVAFVMMTSTLVFVDVFQRWTVGAMAAVLLGWMVGAVVLLVMSRRAGFLGRPRLDLDYLRPVLTLGRRIDASALLVLGTARLDLLLVAMLRGRAPAGQYSISLTVASLATYPAVALTRVLYPRMAASQAPDSERLTERALRMGLTSALVVGLIGAALVPILTPVAFGRGFTPSVTPSVILIAGSIAWSGQWILCRAWAARGEPAILIRSFSVSVATMIILDIALIPTTGTVGAAIASTVASVVGLIVASAFHDHRSLESGRWWVVPRGADIADLTRLIIEATGLDRSAKREGR